MRTVTTVVIEHDTDSPTGWNPEQIARVAAEAVADRCANVNPVVRIAVSA